MVLIFDDESYGLSIVAEASFLSGVCERAVACYISKFLVNGDIKPELAARTAVRDEFIVLAYQIWKPQFFSVVQSPFDNCHSPFSPTTFFEINLYLFQCDVCDAIMSGSLPDT